MAKLVYPQSWKEHYLPAAHIFSVRGHTEFSKRVSEGIIKPCLQKHPNSPTYAIIAVCTYPPKFFYNNIKEYIRTKARDKNSPKVFKNDFKALTNYEGHIEGQTGAFVFEENDSDIVQNARDVFMRHTEAVFPHFADLASAGQQNRVLRLCMYKPPQPSPNKGPLATLREDFAIPAAYAFLKWLNGDSPCYVVNPSSWPHWGIHGESVRDFAIFRSDDHYDLVEYYSDVELMAYVNRLNNARWPLINWDLFYSSIVAEAYKLESHFTEYLDAVHGPRSKMSKKDKLLRLIEELRKFEDKGAVASQYYKKRLDCAEKLGAIINGIEKAQVEILEHALPFTSSTPPTQMLRKFHLNRSEFLNAMVDAANLFRGFVND